MHSRRVGLGDPHEHGLVPAFIGMELEREHAVLLLDFGDIRSLQKTQIPFSLGPMTWGASSTDTKPRLYLILNADSPYKLNLAQD